MDVLESALFLGDYYYLTAAAGFWTWIAVITAALSFWRITAVGPRSPCDKSSPSLRDPAPIHQTTDSPPPAREEPSTPAVSSCDPDDGELTTKGKFTVYYVDDDDGVEGAGDDDGCDIDGLISIKSELYGDDHPIACCRLLLPVVRTTDLGWYRYQDLTSLNGSVVRLWESEGKKLTAS